MTPVLKLSKNTTGRDIIAGDIHGCYDLLMDRLKKLNFDYGKDRLFLTGDLIDRGPDSLKCAKLIYETWCYSVQGNHERMFANWAIGESSSYHTPQDFVYNGGDWVYGITRHAANCLATDMMTRMPLFIFVDGDPGFIVTHARYDFRRLHESDIELFSSRQIDHCVWDREFQMVNESAHWEEDGTPIVCQEIICSNYDTAYPLVYCGHNTMRNGNIVFVDNHVLLDTGAVKSLTNSAYRLSVVDHKKVVDWVKTV